jgi:hypothetical protein
MLRIAAHELEDAAYSQMQHPQNGLAALQELEEGEPVISEATLRRLQVCVYG